MTWQHVPVAMTAGRMIDVELLRLRSVLLIFAAILPKVERLDFSIRSYMHRCLRYLQVKLKTTRLGGFCMVC